MAEARVAVRPPKVPSETPLHNATIILRERWPSSAPRELHAAFDFTLGAMTAPKQEYDRLKKEGKLSPSGIAEKVREHASTFVPRLRTVEGLVETGRHVLEDRRKAIMTPDIDKGDAIGISLRREVRDYLRGLTPTQRLVVLSKAEPLFIAAVLEVPVELSGITEETRNTIMETYINKHHKEELTQMAQQEEAYSVLSSAVQFARGELRRYTGLSQHERQLDPAAPADKPAFRETFEDWYSSIVAPGRSQESAKAHTDIAVLIERAKDEVSRRIDQAVAAE